MWGKKILWRALFKKNKRETIDDRGGIRRNERTFCPDHGNATSNDASDGDVVG